MGTPEISAETVGGDACCRALDCIPGFWRVLFIWLPCWTNHLTCLACEPQGPTRNAFCSVRPMMPHVLTCCLRMTYARTHGGYKVTQDRSQSKEETDLCSGSTLPSSTCWFSASARRGTLLNPLPTYLQFQFCLRLRR